MALLARTALETVLGGAENLAQISGEPGAVSKRRSWWKMRWKVVHEDRDGSPRTILTLQPTIQRSLMTGDNGSATAFKKLIARHNPVTWLNLA